jgi:hypothetical protein
MCDNATNNNLGWSFLKDARTKWPVEGRTWMINQLEADHMLRRRFYSKGELSKAKVERYMKRADDLLELLLVLMHLTGGQPARGTELLSIRYKNTAAGAERNITIEEGMLAFATRYHKGWLSSTKAKVIHRYVPREVADLLIWYLWLVKPFAEVLQKSVGIKVLDNAYLWSTADGQPWPEARMKRALSAAMEAGLGCRINVLQCRHIMIAIDRRHTQAKFEIDHDEDDAADLQAGHTSKIAAMIYARTVMQAPGTTIAMQQAYRDVSLSWHAFLQFGGHARPLEEQAS